MYILQDLQGITHKHHHILQVDRDMQRMHACVYCILVEATKRRRWDFATH